MQPLAYCINPWQLRSGVLFFEIVREFIPSPPSFQLYVPPQEVI
jgi:hypothetical protein